MSLLRAEMVYINYREIAFGTRLPVRTIAMTTEHAADLRRQFSKPPVFESLHAAWWSIEAELIALSGGTP